MSTLDEEVATLTDAVATWRMQEYIFISFFSLYIYYVLSTLREEISIMLPQRWSGGRILYNLIRYGFLVHVALQLMRDYRSYYVISPVACKVLLIVHELASRLSFIASDAALGLCVCALLQAKPLYVAALLTLCMAPPVLNFIFSAVSYIQYPAEPISSLDEELGYPCYYVSREQWDQATIMNADKNAISYLGLAVTIILTGFALLALSRRYTTQKGRLITVIRRDGGAYYLSLAAIRLVGSVVFTPGLLPTSEWDSKPGYILFDVASDVMCIILSQRLIINMRKVDYMGSQPFASTLLFSPQEPSLDDIWSTEQDQSAGDTPPGSLRADENQGGGCAKEAHDLQA